MANQPTTISASETMTTSTMSDSSQSSKNPSIEAAESWNNRLFGLYAAFLIVTAVLATWFTVAVFKAGNKVQEAIKADADVRIEGIKTEGDKARAELGKTNARMTEAEARVSEANRGIEEARRDTAKASKEAALAIERADKLALDLDAQRQVTVRLETEAAKAKKELLEVLERTKQRHLTPAQRATLIDALSKGAKGSCCLIVRHLKGDGESREFAQEIAFAIAGAYKETVVDEAVDESFATFRAELSIDFHDNTQLPQVSSLQSAVQTALGHPVQTRLRTSTMPAGKVVLNIGPKP